ncbi:transporter substrate-binding domain-containing protein [Neiella sp. HB171785]|uniref:Transporter substrate-binding domain-containing protein n=1 Tax=Neiella litorisoli TaxID=2771431 RepID=A0A8J6R2C5_9GAMM|nr:transporter substrate-binding domain-containing protein [Neiella litorisoli]MBD1388765.1 transporter substrate-binding domain-containing protein [Neiella litorisoli]
MTACVASSSVARTITIRADEWYPLNGQPNAQHPGVMIELAKAVFEPNGYAVDYDLLPWKRAVSAVEAGEFDCVVGAYPEDVPGFLLPNHHWGSVGTGLYGLSNRTTTINQLDQLLQYQVGVIKGYAYSDDALNQMIATHPSTFVAVHGSTPLESNIHKLLHQRINIIIESPPVMKNKLAKLGLEQQISLIREVGTAKPVYLACSPNIADMPDIIELVDQQTMHLKRTGDYQNILRKYGFSVGD